MIKIIKGKYGHYIPNDAADLSKGGRIVPITPDSAPIALSPEREKKLVERGVAKYVDATAQSAALMSQSNGQGGTQDPLAYNEEMKLETLKAVAVNGYHCDPEEIDKLRSKKEVIAAIEAAKSANGGSSDIVGGEQPDLKPEEPVQ